MSRSHPTVGDAIDVIHAAGGVAVWAHPFWDVADPDEVLRTIDEFRANGLDGVEVFYPTHDRERTAFLHDACAERGLLMTGSSDYHGPTNPHGDRFLAHDLFGFLSLIHI